MPCNRRAAIRSRCQIGQNPNRAQLTPPHAYLSLSDWKWNVHAKCRLRLISGRKPLFMLDMGMFVLASVMQFFIGSMQFVATSPMQLFVVRLLMGIAIGAEYSVGWPMLSEFSPSRIRGRLMGLTLIAWYAGFMFAFVMGYLLDRYTSLGWRNILGSSTFIAVALFLGRLGMPESPRWLWTKSRTEQARSIAHRYMESTADMADMEHEAAHSGGGFGMLFSRQYWRATLFVSLFFFCVVTPVLRDCYVRR